jgi:predicted ester cyclase
MSENKALVLEYLHALSGRPKTLDIIRKYVADEALTRHILETEKAFPGYRIEAEDVISEDDGVAVRAAFHGVHRGPFAGLPETGKSVTAGLMIIYQFAKAGS